MKTEEEVRPVIRTGTINRNSNSWRCEKEEPVQPRIRRPLKPIRSWREWLVRFDEATSYEEYLSLLHHGFRVSMRKDGYYGNEYTDADRVRTYLQIADGWNSTVSDATTEEHKENFHFGFDEKGREIRKSSADFLEEIQMKALNVVAAEFFKKMLRVECGADTMDPWHCELLQEGGLEDVMGFFRVVTNRLYRGVTIANLNCNGPFSNTQNILVDFLVRLTAYLFNWQERRPYYGSWVGPGEKERVDETNARYRKIVSEAQIWMIEVLSYLGLLDNLRRFELNKAHRKKFKEIATRRVKQSYREEPEPSITLREAWAGRSVAAELVFETLNRLQVEANARRREKAKEELAEAQEKVARLSRRID